MPGSGCSMSLNQFGRTQDSLLVNDHQLEPGRYPRSSLFAVSARLDCIKYLPIKCLPSSELPGLHWSRLLPLK